MVGIIKHIQYLHGPGFNIFLQQSGISSIFKYGLMDMVGSIYEWTSEWYFAYPYKGPYEKGKTKVVRGGKSQFATCSYRGFDVPEYRNPSRGFRCALDC